MKSTGAIWEFFAWTLLASFFIGCCHEAPRPLALPPAPHVTGPDCQAWPAGLSRAQRHPDGSATLGADLLGVVESRVGWAEQCPELCTSALAEQRLLDAARLNAALGLAAAEHERELAEAAYGRLSKWELALLSGAIGFVVGAAVLGGVLYEAGGGGVTVVR